jgi:hypothetical protein
MVVPVASKASPASRTSITEPFAQPVNADLHDVQIQLQGACDFRVRALRLSPGQKVPGGLIELVPARCLAFRLELPSCLLDHALSPTPVKHRLSRNDSLQPRMNANERE